MFDLKEQVALKIGIPACLQDIQLDGRVTENDEWIATTDGFKLSVTLVVRHGLVEFKVANNTNHRNGFAPKMACYSKLISPEPAPLGTIVKAVIRCGDLIMTTEGQWLPLDILEPLRPNYGEDSDVERDYDVMFLRPDGSTEHKTVEWMSSNGFSEIQVGMGIWSSKWMFQPGFVDTVDREDVKHKVGLAMSGVLGNPDLIP
ncbi:unnamed protein product [Prorocentrum cordatum]|uniref:Uncharacterized protein n=1 Tax=Prorocentrum cordatum TaxID=2364126 RepID=A0ABN9XE22_9DINO|nr:unnamed protein product [Polarella glacialis]